MQIKLVTFTTLGAARLACNWLKSVQLLHLDECAHVYCADKVSAEAIKRFVALTRSNASVWPQMNPHYLETGQAIDWGTRAFIEISLAKLALQIKLNQQDGFGPYLFCDADTVLLNDPHPCLDAPDRGIWLQSDRADDNAPSTESNLVNVGVHFCNQPMPQLFEAAVQWLEQRRPIITDQSQGKYADDQAGVCRALEYTGVRWQILPPEQWRNGSQPWPPSFAESNGVILVHANWLVGCAKKEQRFKDAGFWCVPERMLEQAGLGQEFQLLVAHYHEGHGQRSEEYHMCLRHNLECSFIGEVHVFCEDNSPLWADLAKHRKVRIFPLGRRARYADLLTFANRELDGRSCIIANADTWFDETLGELAHYDLTDKFVCLSREDCVQNYCQDAWIFRAPLPNIEADFAFGFPRCDNRIAFEAHRAGLDLLNPAGTITLHHEHESQVRHYRLNEDALPGDALFVPPTKLSGEPISPHNRPANNPYPMGFNPFINIGGRMLPIQQFNKKW